MSKAEHILGVDASENSFDKRLPLEITPHVKKKHRHKTDDNSGTDSREQEMMLTKEPYEFSEETDEAKEFILQRKRHKIIPHDGEEEENLVVDSRENSRDNFDDSNIKEHAKKKHKKKHRHKKDEVDSSIDSSKHKKRLKRDANKFSEETDALNETLEVVDSENSRDNYDNSNIKEHVKKKHKKKHRHIKDEVDSSIDSSKHKKRLKRDANKILEETDALNETLSPRKKHKKNRLSCNDLESSLLNGNNEHGSNDTNVDIQVKTKRKKKKHKHKSNKTEISGQASSKKHARSISSNQSGESIQPAVGQSELSNDRQQSDVAPSNVNGVIDSDEPVRDMDRHSPDTSMETESVRDGSYTRVDDTVPDAASMTEKQVWRLLHLQPLGNKPFVKCFEELVASGATIHLKTGRWTREEDNRLRKNWNKYFKKYPYDDKISLLRTTQYENSKELRDYVRSTQFHMHLAKGIHRPTYNVYLRARKIFHGAQVTGKFSEREVESLKQLHEIHGNKWTAIGKEIGRTGQSMQDKFKMLKPERELGAWTKEEEEQLKNAITQETGADSLENLYHNLPWKKISDGVPTRSSTQCYQHWVMFLSNHKDDPAHAKFRRKDKIELIARLYETTCESEDDIDWDDIMKDFKQAPSPAWLQKKWYELKFRNVPGHQRKSFNEIVEYLYDEVLPTLKES